MLGQSRSFLSCLILPTEWEKRFNEAHRRLCPQTVSACFAE